MALHFLAKPGWDYCSGKVSKQQTHFLWRPYYKWFKMFKKWQKVEWHIFVFWISLEVFTLTDLLILFWLKIWLLIKNWKSDRKWVIFHKSLKKYLPITLGSKSTKTALGTCFPELVSEKKVLKESSPPPNVKSEGIWPSGWIPCSKQYNSQQELPIWTPAWPTWREITSLISSTVESRRRKLPVIEMFFVNEICIQFNFPQRKGYLYNLIQFNFRWINSVKHRELEQSLGSLVLYDLGDIFLILNFKSIEL